MLTAAQFQQWCLRLHLEPSASEAVTRVRSSAELSPHAVIKDQHPAERDQAMWLSLEDQARLAAFKAYAVNHALLEDIDMRLTQAMLEPAGFAHVLVYGPSGVGKTTMLRRVERRVRELYAGLAMPSEASAQWRYPQGNPALPSHPLLVLEARPPDGLTINRADYYRSALLPRFRLQKRHKDALASVLPTVILLVKRGPMRNRRGVHLWGVMNLAPDLIAQTTVAKVECPECGAMRTLHPQGNTVMFPSHPKRLTSTPRDEVRWIRRGTTWELSEKRASLAETETERE